MVTHHLNEDLRSGYFHNDFGYKICQWKWDSSSSTLLVRVGCSERPVIIEHEDINRLPEEELLELIIELAKSIGESLGANFGPKICK